MKPVRCNNCKFFYDEELYQQCPHCQTEAKPVMDTNVVAQPAVNPVQPPVQENFINNVQPPVQAPVNSVQPPVKPAKEFKFGFGKKKKAPVANAPVVPPMDINRVVPPTPVQDVNIPQPIPEIKEDFTQVQNNIPVQEPVVEEKENLRKAIQGTDSMQKTVAFYNLPNENEPVVGWLVCVKGEYIGESFNLKSGRNNIGRALTMDVALAKERSVSREKHASILYEPNKMQFFLQPGDSSGLTYLNEELLMAFNEIKSGDKITLGDCSFIFVPLCGENFNWDKYIEK